MKSKEIVVFMAESYIQKQRMRRTKVTLRLLQNSVAIVLGYVAYSIEYKKVLHPKEYGMKVRETIRLVYGY